MRPLVIKFLPYWRNYLATHGPAKTADVLSKGKYHSMGRKDAFQIKKELGL